MYYKIRFLFGKKWTVKEAVYNLVVYTDTLKFIMESQNKLCQNQQKLSENKVKFKEKFNNLDLA